MSDATGARERGGVGGAQRAPPPQRLARALRRGVLSLRGPRGWKEAGPWPATADCQAFRALAGRLLERGQRHELTLKSAHPRSNDFQLVPLTSARRRHRLLAHSCVSLPAQVQGCRASSWPWREYSRLERQPTPHRSGPLSPEDRSLTLASMPWERLLPEHPSGAQMRPWHPRGSSASPSTPSGDPGRGEGERRDGALGHGERRRTRGPHLPRLKRLTAP